VPFEFPAQLNPVQKISIGCLSSGTAPLQFHWFKKTDLLQDDEDIKIFTNDDVSTLVFKKVSPRHGGNYKCIASNIVGEEEIIVRVSVKGRTFSTGFFFKSSGCLSNDSRVMIRGLFW